MESKENRHTFFCKEIHSENGKQHNRGFKQDCDEKVASKKTHCHPFAKEKGAVQIRRTFINI